MLWTSIKGPFTHTPRVAALRAAMRCCARDSNSMYFDGGIHGDAENARHEIARHENARNAIVWNTACCMPVHCRAGMHESTRKSTRFPVSAPPSQDMCEVCLITQRDARLAFVPCGRQRFCASCVAHLEQQARGCPICHVFLTFTQVVLSVVLSIVLH